MVNFMCRLGWTMRCPVTQTLSWVRLRVFLNAIPVQIVGL